MLALRTLIDARVQLEADLIEAAREVEDEAIREL
jgi:hypothetical protein